MCNAFTSHWHIGENRCAAVLATILIATVLVSGDTSDAKVDVGDQPRTVNVERPARPSSEQIGKAIDLSINYFKNKQVNGVWDTPSATGTPPTLRLTALTLLALSDAGKSPQDGEVREAADILCAAKITDTQSAAMRAEHDCATAWRVDNRKPAGDDVLKAAGLPEPLLSGPKYSVMFGTELSGDHLDHLSSYLALTAIDACQRNRADVPEDFWKLADQQWRQHQLADGGWALSATTDKEIALVSDFRSTAAALLALQLMARPLHAVDSHAFDGCKGNAVDPALDNAVRWFEQHGGQMCDELFHGTLANPCETCWWFQKVILATGHNRIGGRDLSAEMAYWLVANQNEDGSWAGGVGETAYGLRCLAENHNSPAFAKLSYTPGIHQSAWNERPADVRNLANYLGTYCYCGNKQKWEIFDLDQPLADLLEMPVLFISGNNELDFNEIQIGKLREFVERGGLILGNADCGNAAFASSFRQLGKRLFPRYDFRKLLPSHPIFDEMFHGKKWKKQVELEGLSNGVRELLLLIPEADLSLAWQRETRVSQEGLFQVAANIHLYSIDKGYMGGKADLTPAKKVAQNWRTVHVAELQIGDNWNPEPRAWPHMSEIMERNCQVNVEAKPIKPGLGQLAGCDVAHLTGTAAFTFTPTQRDELNAFVDKGGLLLIDAAGGSSEFADAAQNELRLMFGDSAKELDSLIPVGELDSKQPGVESISKVNYRICARRQFTEAHGSRLRAIRLKGRLAVIFSREDLTAGMAGVHSDGILGYDVPTASAIVRNILLYAMPPG